MSPFWVCALGVWSNFLVGDMESLDGPASGSQNVQKSFKFGFASRVTSVDVASVYRYDGGHMEFHEQALRS